ncbi:MAG: ribonuclease domain-containing protein [Providencia sp.]|uniref:ribonuclease domain-containing protein n=1 Tax=Providencia sp. TaxID=589 RepID=UPI003F9C55D6
MNKRIISMILMAILIAISLYFKGDDLHDKEQVERPISPPEQSIRNENAQEIDALTQQRNVVSYVQKHQKLPDFYVTKKDARLAGWDAKKGNLCEGLPGKAIGGDKFLNREKRLPISPNRQWFEADINYRCGHRGADRLMYSSDGMIFVTLDHYKSFQQVN